MSDKIERIYTIQAVLSRISEEQSARRKRRTWGRSCLVKFRGDLYELRRAGASLSQLQFWLKQEKRISVARSTVFRFLGKKAGGG